MADYLVEMHGDCREVYLVTADSEDEARTNWMDGALIVSEAGSMELHSVRLDDE